MYDKKTYDCNMKLPPAAVLRRNAPWVEYPTRAMVSFVSILVSHSDIVNIILLYK